MNKVLMNHNRKTAILVKEGRKFMHLVVMNGSGIKVVRIKNDAFSKDWYEVRYDLRMAAVGLLRAGASFGITDEAKALLLGIAGLTEVQFKQAAEQEKKIVEQ